MFWRIGVLLELIVDITYLILCWNPGSCTLVEVTRTDSWYLLCYIPCIPGIAHPPDPII